MLLFQPQILPLYFWFNDLSGEYEGEINEGEINEGEINEGETLNVEESDMNKFLNKLCKQKEHDEQGQQITRQQIQLSWAWCLCKERTFLRKVIILYFR